MNNVSDVLTVSFDSGLKDEPALCVTRKHGEKIIMLKMELGEQADILYHLLTEQMTKAEIKTESEGKECPDAVSRQAVLDYIEGSEAELGHSSENELVCQDIKELPPVTPIKIGYCKDCKWWKDSDGSFRRGIGAESQCPINYQEVYEGTGYCYIFEPRESEGGKDEN